LGYPEQRRVAERGGRGHFEILLTTDKNMRFQQNLAKRAIAIVVLGNSRWHLVRRYVDRVVVAVNAAKPGTYDEIEIPEG
jgi:hypothetical protein